MDAKSGSRETLSLLKRKCLEESIDPCPTYTNILHLVVKLQTVRSSVTCELYLGECLFDPTPGN